MPYDWFPAGYARTSDGMSSANAFAKLAIPSDEQSRVSTLSATLR